MNMDNSTIMNDPGLADRLVEWVNQNLKKEKK